MAESAIQAQTGGASTNQILSEMMKRLQSAVVPEGTSYFKSEAYHKKLLDKAAYYNSVPGGLRYYNCTKCSNKGVIEYITDEWDESCKVCDCMRIRACYSAMARSGITEAMINRFTFENFSTMKDYQARMLNIAKRYAESDLSFWLYMGGQSGSGKTHLCTAVAKHLLEKGREVRYVLWHDFARKAQAMKYRLDEYDAYIREVADADVLYIDDLFKADKSSGTAFELINQRYMSRRPTIISSELFISEITSKMDEALGSRLTEMSKGFCALINQDPDRNYRTKEAGI